MRKASRIQSIELMMLAEYCYNCYETIQKNWKGLLQML